MTDQAPAPSAPAEGAAAPPSPVPVRSWKDVMAELESRTGDAMARAEKLVRFNWQGKDFLIDKPNPSNPNFVSFVAFHDDETIRVYEGMKTAVPDEYPIRRITFSKGSSDFVIEGMNVDRMLDLVSEELNALADSVTTAERERAAVLAYLASKHPATGVPTLIQEITRGDHLDDDDEDEEPSRAANGATS